MRKDAKKSLEQTIKNITSQEMIQLMVEFLSELEEVLKYLKKINHSPNHVSFRIRISSEAFYENVIKPLEVIVGWDDEKEEKIKMESNKDALEIDAKTWQEKRNAISAAVKVAKTGSKIAAGAGIGIFIAHLFLKKKTAEKDKEKNILK